MTACINTVVLDRDFRYALRDYFNTLSADKCEDYMQRCGVTYTYAKSHLIKTRSEASHMPGKMLIYALADESERYVTRLQSVYHFYPEIRDGLECIVKAGQMINCRQEQLRLPEYLYSLSDEAKSDYARRVGSTRRYVTGRLIRKQTIPACIPNKPLLLALADEGEGQVSRFQALFYYFPEIGQDVLNLIQ